MTEQAPSDFAPLIDGLRSEKPATRFMSAERLAHFDHDDHAVRALMDWMEREEGDRLWNRAFATVFDRDLLKMSGAVVAPHLLERLDAAAARTRWRAAVWLARLGDPAGADTLAAFLDNQDDVPPIDAALVLEDPWAYGGNAGDPDTLTDAVLALSGPYPRPITEGGNIRVAAAWALGLIGDARALPVLLPLVTNEHDAGSIVPALERILARDAARVNEADLRAATTLDAPPQGRGFGDDSQFGPGPWVKDLGSLNLHLVRELANTELTRRAGRT